MTSKSNPRYFHNAPVLPVPSAGGVGVMLNADRVAEQLASQGHRGVQVRGLADSSWFPIRKPYKPADRDAMNCQLETAKRGYRWDEGADHENRECF